LYFPNTAATGLNLGSASVFAGIDFTLSVWFRRVGTGTAISIGTGGQTSLEPILTGGVGQAETPLNYNCAFALGWVPATSKIGVDFEDANNGTNHPFTFTTALSNNVDYHICTTYNHTTGVYYGYVNGVSDGTVTVTGTSLVLTPETSSIQGCGIATAITTTAGRSGAFNGIIWNAAIWNVDLSAAEVAQIANAKITGTELQTRPANLRGFWPLDDAPNGATLTTAAKGVSDRSGRGLNGTAFGTITGNMTQNCSYL
jgi:hypothetical protein